MMYRPFNKQRGFSLLGWIAVLIIVVIVLMLAMKVVPAVVEYRGIVKAIEEAKRSGTTVLEIRRSFDKRAEVGYLESIRGYDLDVVQVGNEFEVSFAYDKKIPLVGPASLLLEFSGSTAKGLPTNNARTPGK
jgi:type II secretory pathway pseudopilin PulG